MVATRKLEIQITGDTTSASRLFGNVDDAAGRTQSTMSKWSTRVAGLIGAAFAVDRIIDWGSTLISEAEEAQKVTAQTAAVITSMGDVAGVTADQVADLAEAISLKTGIDDEMIQSGENVLLTFRNIRDEVGEGNDVFTRATKAAVDMSVAMDQDLQTSVLQIGKALNDPIVGMTALTRAGVQFSSDQKAVIEQLVATGDTLGAQKIILGELERQFGGSAEAQATASDKLRVAWSNVQEQLGTALLPIFEKVATWLAETLPGAIDTAITWLKENEDTVKNLAIAFGVILVGAIGAYVASMVVAAISTIIAMGPILLIIGLVLLLAGALYYAYQNWGWFRTGIDTAVQGLLGFIGVAKDAIGFIDSLSDKLTDFFGMNITKGVSGVVAKASAAGSKLPPTGAAKFDRGGTLAPGINVVDNQTGRPEPLVPPHLAGGGTTNIYVTVQHQGLLDHRGLISAVNEGMAKGFRLQAQGRSL